MCKEINKKEIENNLKNKEVVFNSWANDSLKALKNYIPVFDTLIKDREKDIERLLYEIKILKNEKSNRIIKIEELEKQEIKTIIEIQEHKKPSQYGEYSLYLTIKNVSSETNETINVIKNEKLNFKQRVSERDLVLMRWIQYNKVEEIYTNVNINKFIKNNSLDWIKVIETK